MAAAEVTIRDAIKTAIDAAIPTYAITTLTSEVTYFPRADLEDLETPVIKIVATGFGSERTRVLRTAQVNVEDIGIQIALQQRVLTKDDTSTMDDLVEVAEQIMDTVESDDLATGYSWIRTEPLRDDNGTIYGYDQLASDNVFQVIFTAFYSRVKQ